ncbi:MAG: hypothetical protein ABIH52_01380 [Candidatus Aenigmatarchaeota archaeon]
MRLLWLGPVVMAVCMILFVQQVQGLQLTNNMYFSITENASKCVDVILPDDLGYSSPDKIDYIISSTDDDDWVDISSERVRTDEENPVIFPVCFSGFMKQVGDCSDPFVVSIYSPDLDKKRDFNVGVCVSDYVDVDIADIGDGSVEDVLNRNVDFFDIGFESERVFLSPNEVKQISAFVESYGDFIIDVTANGLDINPSSMSVVTTEADPFKTLGFTIEAPELDGEYEVTLDANIHGCDDSFCSKSSTLVAIVGSEAPSFTVSVFPKTLNVKSIGSVLYRMTIENNGDTADFNTNIILPSGVTSNFEPDTYTIESGAKKVIVFIITPENRGTLYDIKVTATSNSVLKQDSSQLSVNEMQTDSLRSSTADTTDELNDWLDDYQTSEYGEDLDAYRDLHDVFSTTGQPDDSDDVGDGNDDAGDLNEGTPGFDYIWLIIPVVVVIVVLVIFMKKRGKSEEYFTPDYPLRSSPLQTLL